MDALKIGMAIRMLRLRVGYTQHELADRLNVTDKAVSKWERGLSIPDISIVTKLSNLLNCDVDNLLEGNITYLEKTWQGLLILKDYPEIHAGSEVYGKPLVDILLSFFLLAGIGDIHISCTDRDRAFIERKTRDGAALGVNLKLLPDGETLPPSAKNTMVIYDNPFVYGPYLTRCFQRAMSRENGVSVLTIEKHVAEGENRVVFDKNNRIYAERHKGTQRCSVPILFFPKRWFENIADIETVKHSVPLYAEPLDNGVIEYLVDSRDALYDTSFFFRYLKDRMGKDIYDIGQIAVNRFFLEP